MTKKSHIIIYFKIDVIVYGKTRIFVQHAYYTYYPTVLQKSSLHIAHIRNRLRYTLILFY